MLAASAGACAFPSIVNAQTLGLNGKTAPSNRVTLGFIGVGGMGGGTMRAAAGNPAVEILSVCDTDGQRAARALGVVDGAYAKRKESGEYKGCQTTDDFRTVLARKDIDAVVISLPDHWHAIPVIMAARAGKDIYAEKPLALTIPEGRAMVNAVEQSGVVCQIGSQQRSGLTFQRAIEAVRNGLLGKIKRVRVGLPGGGPNGDRAKITAPMAAQTPPTDFNYDMWLGPAPWAPYYVERCHWDFRWQFDYSGGQLSDWIGHHFDSATLMTGVNGTGPVAIKDAQAKFLTGPLYNTASQYSFSVHYGDGTVIEVANNYKGGVELEGTEGSVFVTRSVVEFSSPQLQSASTPSQGYRMERTGHFNNFLDCIKTRSKPVCPIADAHRTASVAHLANAAFRSGRSELKWDPINEVVIDAPDAARLLTRAYRAPWQLPV
ncbi:MAG TPA: Gfo/Idh/MocA family oxidoreductase [Candidatus Methylacidiphilales bacterium]|nr:Gfo/Idh/MocA family oxidoreductase [Candidatus Methylacidiphilales bacterium]